MLCHTFCTLRLALQHLGYFVADGLKYWHGAGSADSTRPVPGRWRPPYQRAQSFDIEMTAYALLTYSRLGDISGSVPIARWIVAQRNSHGGFSSTQVNHDSFPFIIQRLATSGSIVLAERFGGN